MFPSPIPRGWIVTGPDGAVTHGADQDWFPDLWQQRAGCGPTAAAVILLLSGPGPGRSWPPLPGGGHGPRLLHRPDVPGVGARDPCFPRSQPAGADGRGHGLLAAARGLTLTPGLFVFPSARTKRPPYEQVEAFVRRALERDCPVAFLNLHNGRVKELDYWHWVTITALEDTTAVILDSGSALRIDLRLWYETTKRRGGFVAALGDPA